MSGQTPYNLNEGALNSAISFVSKQINKQVKARGAAKVGQIKQAEADAKSTERLKAKADAKSAKEEAKTAKAAADKKSASAAKGAATRKENAAPKPGRMSGSKGIDARPSGFPAIKPVVLNRTQHFESAIGNAKDTPAAKPTAPKKDTTQISIDPSTAYND